MNRIVLAGSAVIAIAIASNASAQEQTDAAVQNQQANEPEATADIVVTAQKRSERLQDVPAAITAVRGDALESAAVPSLDDVAKVTPGLIVGSFTPAKPIVFIRGIGTRQIGIGSDPSVGVFIDDQYVGQVSGFLTGLADIERVEVLKGPQGTLYGRNTIGGVISIVTKAPSTAPEGSLEAGLTNRVGHFVRGTVSGPLAGDSLRARVSAFSSKSNGYMLNLATGNRAQGEDQTGLRARIAFDATDRLMFMLTASTLHDTAPAQLGKSAGPLLFFRSPLVTVPTPTPSPYADRYDRDSSNDRLISSLTLRTDWRGDALTVSSITGYRFSRLDAVEDADNTILDVETQREHERVREYSEELRLSSEQNGALSLGGRLDWLAGLYLYHDDASRSDIFEWGRDSFPVFLSQLPASLTGYTGGPVSRIATGGALTRQTDSAALFGQARFAVTGKLGLTLGLRYTREHKHGIYEGTTDVLGLPPILAPFTSDVARAWTSFDPRVTIDWHATPDVMAYATFARGFKSGGFQFVVVDKSLSDRMFDPERVSSYEAGLKAQLFDRRVTLDLAAFHYDYSNLQLLRLVATTAGASTVVDNVAQSKVDGAELDLRWAVSRQLSLGTSYAYLNARFSEYGYATGQDFSGTPLPRAPKNTLTMYADLDIPLGSEVSLGLHADWNYTARFTHEPGGFGTRDTTVSLNPAFIEPSHNTVDLRASLDFGKWRISGFVNNLFDEAIRAAIQDFPAIPTPFGDIGSQTANYWAPPRTYGASVAMRF